MVLGRSDVAVENAGICAIVNDPRTTLAEGLLAILVAELVDNAGWEQPTASA